MSIVKVGSETQKMETFQDVEPFMAMIAALREEVAKAREPSAELLQMLDKAIEATNDQGESLREAAASAGKIQVGSYLAMLLKAYPNAGLQDAKFYGGFLHDDVMELRPPVAAVEIACRHWRQKSKFLPAISELLIDVKAAKDQVDNTVKFIAQLPALRERMIRELAGS